MINRIEVLNLINMDAQYQDIDKKLAKYEYLSKVNEESLLTHFKTALKVTTTNPFDNFTQ